jgi:putative heme iron utilization protein
MDEASLNLLPRLIRSRRTAALGTLRQGAPFVSMIAYAPGEDLGSLFILASRLAHHTQDILEDSRCSVLIAESDDGTVDPQTLPRVTLSGEARALMQDDPAYDAARALYLRRFPEAEFLFQLGDFSLYRIAVSSGRFIAGLGKAYNITRHDLVRAAGHPTRAAS